MSQEELTGDDDEKEDNDDANDDPHAHLHVLHSQSTRIMSIPRTSTYLPPHLLADAVGATSESLSRVGQIVGLVLK